MDSGSLISIFPDISSRTHKVLYLKIARLHFWTFGPETTYRDIEREVQEQGGQDVLERCHAVVAGKEEPGFALSRGLELRKAGWQSGCAELSVFFEGEFASMLISAFGS